MKLQAYRTDQILVWFGINYIPQEFVHSRVDQIPSAFNQSINMFNVLGGNWDPTDKKLSSVNSYRQDLLPTCKAFPKETTTCIWFTQSHKVCNSTTVLQEVQMWPDVAVRWAIKNKVLLVLHIIQ